MFRLRQADNLATYVSLGNPKLNGTPYQLAQTAGNLIDPVARRMMSLFPMPNIPGGSIYDNWITSGASAIVNNQFDIKIDHRFGEKNLLSAKYSQNWNNYSPYRPDASRVQRGQCGAGYGSQGFNFGVINYTAVWPRQCQLALKFSF